MTMGAQLDYGFSTLGEPGIPLVRIIELSRQDAAGGVELRVADGELLHPSMSLDAATDIGRELAAAGVTVLAISSYVALCAPADKASHDADAQPDAGLAWHLQLAARVGARGVRVFMKGDEPDFATAEFRGAARLRSVAEVSRRTGVRVLVETHDSHPTGHEIARFLERSGVTPDVTGVIWDTAHSWAAGESPAESLEALGPWLAHLQIKDVAHRADPFPVEPGAGSYPIDELADAVATRGWRGWAVLEWERAWYPELGSLAEALPTAREWAAALLAPTIASDPATPDTTRRGERS